MKKSCLGIFDPTNSDPTCRIIEKIDDLKEKIKALRVFDHTIVLTMGTFDLTHIGHCRYMQAAKNNGDFLVVGVDSDEKTRNRKGPHRPVVSENERLELLCYIRPIDLLILKKYGWPKWFLIKQIQPDVLIATSSTYTAEEIKELEENYCGKVVVLDPQATTSTSAKVRKIMVDGLDRFKDEVKNGVPDLLDQALETVLSESGERNSK